MAKKEIELFRVQLDGPRPALGGFPSYKEALLFARNNIRVPDGILKEAYLDDRIGAYKKRVAVEERETVKKRRGRGPSKKSLGVFQPLTARAC